jgi:hypothetical protein
MRRVYLGMMLALLAGVYACSSSRPLLYPWEGVPARLITQTAVADTLEITTADWTTVTIEYKFNRSREEFEAYQDPQGSVTYKLHPWKFCGKHHFDWAREIEFTEESGQYGYSFTNDFGSNTYMTGKGYVAINILASYTDKNNKKHKGVVANTIMIPAVFRR